MIGLTVHTKCSLLLCSKHLQFPGEELHSLLDALALGHGHLRHTGRKRTKIINESFTCLQNQLIRASMCTDTINLNLLILKRKQAHSLLRTPLRTRAGLRMHTSALDFLSRAPPFTECGKYANVQEKILGGTKTERSVTQSHTMRKGFLLRSFQF